ncbi:putative ABC transport system ATP-binding protein [Corynebacterium hesseae]
MRDMAQILSLTDITKDFGGGPVLAGISLDIEPGELVAVMGPSGSGKSTLLHCMSGVLTPTHGSVRYGDEELSALGDAPRSRTRLRNFGFVFQDGQLLPELSNVDNVALPAMLNGMGRGAARKRAMELLDQLGLGGLAERRPAQVSGGQAQRVTIARALVASPGVVFADEPTGALDQSTGHEVMQMLTTIVRQSGASLVMVTHDPKVADWMQRRVEIRDGIIHDDRRLEVIR